MIDLENEKLISLGEAAEYVGELAGTKPVAFSTAYTWCVNGANGACLDYVKIGNRMRTSREAVRRFVTEQTANSRIKQTGTVPDQTTKELEEAGLL